jgi:hypothetical protein
MAQQSNLEMMQPGGIPHGNSNLGVLMSLDQILAGNLIDENERLSKHPLGERIDFNNHLSNPLVTRS